MKEHVLNPGDRAALQALVPLAGALGVGTTFALFFGGRRKAGFAVLELFTIVAILTAVGSTAYFSIVLLHQNQPIGNADLTQTATPLVVAVFLLVFVSVLARLPGSGMRAVALLPLALVGIVVAALLASTSWSTGPENASLLALIILAVGLALGGVGWAIERLDIGWDRRSEHRRLTMLYAAGYLPEERPLRVALPAKDQTAAAVAVPAWVRRGKLYLDMPGWFRLRREAGASWRALATGEARPPVGSSILVHVKVAVRLPALRDRAAVRLSLIEPGRSAEPELVELHPNDDGLFDVTDSGLI